MHCVLDVSLFTCVVTVPKRAGRDLVCSKAIYGIHSHIRVLTGACGAAASGFPRFVIILMN
jgi:hypothetical protein